MQRYNTTNVYDTTKTLVMHSKAVINISIGEVGMKGRMRSSPSSFIVLLMVQSTSAKEGKPLVDDFPPHPVRKCGTTYPENLKDLAQQPAIATGNEYSFHPDFVATVPFQETPHEPH